MNLFFEDIKKAIPNMKFDGLIRLAGAICNLKLDTFNDILLRIEK